MLERKGKKMNGIVQACSQAISRRDKLFKKLTEIDLVGNTNEVQDPKLIFNSLFLTNKYLMIKFISIKDCHLKISMAFLTMVKMT